MQEQSHKAEMRAALRGDFERLRARRQAAGVGEPVAEESGAPPDVEPTASTDMAQDVGRARRRGLRGLLTGRRLV